MPLIVPVSAPDDPSIEAYRDIRDRDLKGRAGAFMAEGEVVLRLLLQRSPERVRSVLIAEPRLAPLRDALSVLADDVPVHVAPPAVMSAVAGFAIHRGVLALGARPPVTTPEALLARLPRRALVLGLAGIANHDNIGGIFRNAAAFGADAVLVDAATCDPLYRKAIRVSVGAALAVPFARGADGAALMDALEAAGFSVLALSPGGRERIDRVERPERVALLLGAEGSGLDETLLGRARTVRIAMPGAIDSLNVATAAGIALHRLTSEFSRAPIAPASRPLGSSPPSEESPDGP